MDTKINILWICFVGAVSISCKERSKEKYYAEATFTAAAGAPTYKNLPLIGSCTKKAKTNQVAVSDCTDFYGKISVSGGRSRCNLKDSDQFTHDDTDLTSTLVLNQACSREGMQGGGLYDFGGAKYTSNSESIEVDWYKIDNPSFKDIKQHTENWIEP